MEPTLDSVKIAVQLYTLRDLTADDFFGTIERLAEIGFKTGQPAGLFGNDPKEIRRRCDDIGFRLIAPHVGLDDLEDRPGDVVEICVALGTQHAVLPWIGSDVYADGWGLVADRFERIGKRLIEDGVRLLYHNHAFEFEQDKLQKRPGFQVLWEAANPEYVQCEIDLYWVQYGGGDPVAYLNRLSGRVVTMHFKDMSAGADRGFEDVGSGVLQWDSIIEAARETNVQYAIIERDTCIESPLVHVGRSREYMLSMGLRD